MCISLGYKRMVYVQLAVPMITCIRYRYFLKKLTKSLVPPAESNAPPHWTAFEGYQLGSLPVLQASLEHAIYHILQSRVDLHWILKGTEGFFWNWPGNKQTNIIWMHWRKLMQTVDKNHHCGLLFSSPIQNSPLSAWPANAERNIQSPTEAKQKLSPVYCCPFFLLCSYQYRLS